MRKGPGLMRTWIPKPQTAALVVAASDALYPERADFHCSGVNDNVEIQAALDLLPATGGEVALSDGTFNCEASLVLDSNQTLRGQGRSTILTTATANLDIITAAGVFGTEKVGILIADLRVQGGGVARYGIAWEFIDSGRIIGIWSWNNKQGIRLFNCDDAIIVANVCQGNSNYGIYNEGGEGNIISDNACQKNGTGIFLTGADFITLAVNTCRENDHHGIYLTGSDNCNILGNTCRANSQDADNTEDNIFLNSCDYNLISNNICRRGGLANKPRYGIYISDAGSNENVIQGNDLRNAGSTANFRNSGTLTTVEENNRGIGVPQVRRYVYMKNTSGGQLVAGNVVIFKRVVAAGDEFTTTVILGDDHVLGMVAETIADDAYGLVLVAGKTTVLAGSNDNGNIAVGDFLCASDTATEAVLATAGTTAFAIALEALAAAGPTPLDALLINPLTF